jgi:hypothetical protein
MGEAVVYVKAQLGHASISFTVDTYGKRLPKGDLPEWIGPMMRSCAYLCVEGLRRKTKRGKLLERLSTASPAREARSFPHGRECRLCAA